MTMRTRRRRIGWAVVMTVAAAGLFASDVRAEEAHPMTRKLGRGAANILFSFTEIPHTMMDTGKVYGGFAGATWGLAQGVYMTAMRMGAGVVEVLTFPVPFPTMDYDEPLIKPEFPGRR